MSHETIRGDNLTAKPTHGRRLSQHPAGLCKVVAVLKDRPGLCLVLSKPAI